MDAKEAVHSVEQAARGSALELATTALRVLDAALRRVGLQRRSSMLVPVGILAAGAVIGGVVVLAIAPASGKTVRRRVARFLWSEIDAVEERASKVAERVSETVHGNGTKHAT